MHSKVFEIVISRYKILIAATMLSADILKFACSIAKAGANNDKTYILLGENSNQFNPDNFNPSRMLSVDVTISGNGKLYKTVGSLQFIKINERLERIAHCQMNNPSFDEIVSEFGTF